MLPIFTDTNVFHYDPKSQLFASWNILASSFRRSVQRPPQSWQGPLQGLSGLSTDWLLRQRGASRKLHDVDDAVRLRSGYHRRIQRTVSIRNIDIKHLQSPSKSADNEGKGWYKGSIVFQPLPSLGHVLIPKPVLCRDALRFFVCKSCARQKKKQWIICSMCPSNLSNISFIDTVTMQ